MLTELTDKTFKGTIQQPHADLIVVDLWAPWCMPCMKMQPILEGIEMDFEGEVRFYSLNISKYPAIATENGIMSIPTLLLYKGGTILSRVVGSRSREELLTYINKHL